MRPPTPDSRRSWAVAGVAFLAMFAAVGAGYAYGVLLPVLVSDVGIDPGAASGVFSVTILVFFLAGAPAGALADRDGPRRVLVAGAAMTGGGLLLASAATGPAALFVGHGLLVGAGMATTFVPLTAVVARVFDRQRVVAMSVAVSGIGVGTLVMAPLVAGLIDVVGWRQAYAGLGVGTTVVLSLCALLLPGPATAQDAPAGEDPVPGGVLGTRDYRVLYGAQVLLALALFIPFALLPAYAQSSGVAPVAAAGLVGLLGLASVVGRLLLGVVARRFGVLSSYRFCYLLIGGSFALWLLPGGSYAALAVFAVAFGIGYGGFVALLPAVVAELFGLARFGTLIGILYTANAFGAGVGPWVAGALVEPYGFLPAALLGLAAGLLAFAVLRRLRVRPLGPERAS
jgi:MFS family permease